MKILQMIYSLSSGGAERFVVDLSNELANQGHEVHLVVFRENQDNLVDMHFYKFLLCEKVTYHNLAIKEGIRLSAFTKVTRFVLQLKVDIVHCHLNVIPFIFPLALINNNIKFYHTLHNLANKTVGHNIQKKLNYYFYKTNKIKPIAISEVCNQSYRDFYKLDNAKVILNGRSEVQATEKYIETKHEIETYKQNNKTTIFIHIARFNKQKNQDLLINTFNKLANQSVNFVLMIIGSGFDSPEGKRLQEKACDSIKFLGEKQNVSDYLLCSSAFCLSSYYEGFPISLLEALSAGCIPICTPVGGISDVIVDGITGFLSDDVSEKSYYDAVERYIDNPTAINTSYLQDYFINNYSIQKCAQSYLNLFLSHE